VILAELAVGALGAVRLVSEEEAAELGPGLIGFAVVVALAIATFLLIRSMLYHIKKVPPTFDDQAPAEPEQSPDVTGGEGSDSGVGER
jgi:hypothetical protein